MLRCSREKGEWGGGRRDRAEKMEGGGSVEVSGGLSVERMRISLGWNRGRWDGKEG